MENIRHYILFPSHTEGLKLQSALKKGNIRHTIVPTPRELSVSCGIAIMYNREDEKIIQELIDENNVKTLGFHCVNKKIINPYL